MIEGLTPPKGPWQKKYGALGPQFECVEGVDSTTGIKTTWTKDLSPNAQIVTRFNKHPNGVLERFVMDGVNVTGRHVIYTIKDQGERDQVIQLGYADDHFRGLSFRTGLDEAKRPAFLNIKEITAAYALDGALSSVRIYIDSQKHFNETDYQGCRMEDNLRELLKIFQASGPSAASPFITVNDQEDAEAEMVSMHGELIRQWVAGKLMQWSDAEKKSVDNDLNTIFDDIDSVAQGTMSHEQIRAMSTFVIFEVIKVLPDGYPKLKGSEREEAFNQAFGKAILQCFQFHDYSLQKLAQHTIVFSPNPLLMDQYMMVVFQGHPLNPFSKEEETEVLRAQPAEIGFAYEYEGTDYGLLRQQDYLGIVISSEFNRINKVLYLAPEKLLIDEVLTVIKTNHPSDWMRAYDIAPMHLKVIPSKSD